MARRGLGGRTIGALAAASLLAACSLEPAYVRPAAPIPSAWPRGAAYVEPSDRTLPSVSYQDIFRDPRLQRVIAQALAANRDLRVAAANAAQARAVYRVQRAERLPTIGANGSATFTRVDPGAVGAAGGSRIEDSYSVNLGLAAFELDLFGRIRSLSNAALDEYFATEAAARAVRLTIVADTASAWLTLAADRSLLAIARATEESAGRSVRLTQARLGGGISSRIDLAQATTVLATARADAANLTTQVAQDRNALELLAGSPVADALLPASIEQVDGSLAELPAGLDSGILLRRPDVAQAEFQLRAANARIGAARANFFPRIGLTAAFGFASGALGSLFKGDSFTATTTPTIGVPVFDGGANRGNLDATRAARVGLQANYERAIQTAFRDVADALARRGTIAEEVAARVQFLNAAEDNFRLSDARYRNGIESFLTSLDAQRTLYAAQQLLATIRLERADNLVTLYRVLGGDARVEEGEFARSRGPRAVTSAASPASIPTTASTGTTAADAVRTRRTETGDYSGPPATPR